MPNFNAKLVPAMVTPFHLDGSLDLDAMAKLAVYLSDNGCDGLLVNGTTGESPTLSKDEKITLIQTVQEAVQDKSIPVMAGVGSNNTAASVEEAQATAALGVDVLLLTMPYYNKPTQAGMKAHFGAIAEAVPGTQCVIYNIPSRSVVEMTPATMEALHAQHPNIIGVKQSVPNMDAVSEISKRMQGKNWLIWSGDDSLTLPMMACGAHGCVSVLAHLAGNTLREMIEAFHSGDSEKAREYHWAVLNPARNIFKLPNPAIVKTALAEQGLIGPTLRLPMLSPTHDEMPLVQNVLDDVSCLQLTSTI